MAEAHCPNGEAEQDASRLNWASLTMEARLRFIALQDPADNWMVYDLHSEVPAEFTCKVLYGLSREEAEHLTVLANAKFRSRTAIAEPMLGRPALG
ncbi:hypothetical protein NKI77_24865 [Mesorhizobium opportunistum]|uniref:Uncharacterized protein n=1 Tax=Mesorhizobium opportunistum TaxID=593909 RepID=A0ABV1YJL3_9HYPH|nr:hypothetical protein [Mesorhizobium sp.]TIN98735.1 MAG: hypothetical protein E5Y06_02010 [Mesorhizobium sp.]TJU99325.1 MAG: hypothetical protein E5Y08_10695 [Mesorhizobium sp.]TJV04488.1 MAG: hypothetical protein E5Y12_12410 [Mesorhizobium sp.]TJV19260.1 MAG: hypothetical protein E5Y07_04190 [Mesorhizobium sp.]